MLCCHDADNDLVEDVGVLLHNMEQRLGVIGDIQQQLQDIHTSINTIRDSTNQYRHPILLLDINVIHIERELRGLQAQLFGVNSVLLALFLSACDVLVKIDRILEGWGGVMSFVFRPLLHILLFVLLCPFLFLLCPFLFFLRTFSLFLRIIRSWT